MIIQPGVSEIWASMGNGEREGCVTVAVSLYNYAKYISECLDSIAAQTHNSIELIVVDDTSDKDDSLDVALSWLREHQGRFRRSLLLHHDRNQGLAQARNTAFSAASSDTIFVIDADNSIYRSAIAKLYAVLNCHYHGAAYSQLRLFGDEDCLGLADLWSKEKLKKGNYIDAMALVRKSAWEAVGGYSPTDGWEDFDFWCKFIEHGIEAIFLPETLCRYRVHGASMLKSETSRIYDELKNVIVMRHPWVEFED
jgi:glycosyltransferase involved in cell wall biosynthesis